MPENLLALPNALLEAVDALPSYARGAFIVTRDGVDHGMVIAEHNRVCWATALGLELRLRELMIQHAGRRIDRKQLLAVPGVSRALRQHSVESLTSLCGSDEGTIRWIPRDTPLNAATTFAPVELLASVGAHFYAKEGAAARKAVLPDGDVGASFALGDDGDLVMVQEVGGERLGISALCELGQWAHNSLEATPGFSIAMIERAIAGVKDSVALAWRISTRVVHAILVEERRAIDRAVAWLKQQRLAAVVSICVPWKLRTTVVRDVPEAARRTNA